MTKGIPLSVSTLGDRTQKHRSTNLHHDANTLENNTEWRYSTCADRHHPSDENAARARTDESELSPRTFRGLLVRDERLVGWLVGTGNPLNELNAKHVPSEY